MKSLESENEWDKKKIFIALVLAFILLLGGIYLVRNGILGELNSLSEEGVQGVTADKENTNKELDRAVSQDASLSLETVIQDKLAELKKEVGSLNVTEVATASPQIQKIIKDINALKDYPVNEAKGLCRQICGL